MKRFLIVMVFFSSIIFIWQGVYMSNVVSPMLLPSPLDVLIYTFKNIQNGELISASIITMKRLFLGYLIGCALAIPLGLLTAQSKYLSDTVGVLALGLQALPSVCWVPLALIWFGQTETAMLFVVVMGTMWSVLIAVDHGVQTLPPIYVRAAKTMGSKGLHTLIKVILPASFPFLISGMKQGWAFAWRSLMSAEIYVTILSGYGLGHLLHFGRELNSMDQVIGIMIVIILIGLLSDKIMFSPWEKFIHQRWGTSKS